MQLFFDICAAHVRRFAMHQRWFGLTEKLKGSTSKLVKHLVVAGAGEYCELVMTSARRQARSGVAQRSILSDQLQRRTDRVWPLVGSVERLGGLLAVLRYLPPEEQSLL